MASYGLVRGPVSMRPWQNAMAINMQSCINTLPPQPWYTPNCVEFSAQCFARDALREALDELCAASGACCAEALDRAAYEMGRLVGHDFLDRSETADALTQACVANGYSFEVGPDLVQEAIASGFRAGEAAAFTELEETSDQANEQANDVDIK